MSMDPEREHFKSLLNSLGRFDDSSLHDIEAGVYNWTLQFAERERIPRTWKNQKFAAVYNNKARSVLANLDPDSYIGNTRCVTRLQDEEFLPSEVAFLTRETLFPDRWKEVLDKKVKKDEHVFEERPQAMTNQFRCGKCKKRECVFQELQLRSCDEPMTLFITCLNCGNRWRIG